jgi:hypothetical protein
MTFEASLDVEKKVYNYYDGTQVVYFRTKLGESWSDWEVLSSSKH